MIKLNYRIEDAVSWDDLPVQQLLDDIGFYLLNTTLERFEAEETPEGESWEKSYRADKDGGKTLQDKGHLRDSYTYNLFGGEEGVEVGSNLIYAAIHHEGGEIKGKNGKLKFRIGNSWVQKEKVVIPARPALGINSDDEQEILAITEDLVKQTYNKGN